MQQAMNVVSRRARTAADNSGQTTGLCVLATSDTSFLTLTSSVLFDIIGGTAGTITVQQCDCLVLHDELTIRV